MMHLVRVIEGQIADAMKNAAGRAREAGDLQFAKVPDFVVEVPREKAHGDFAVNLAMLLARQARQNPRQVAETLVRHLDTTGTWIARAEVAGPGFINFTLDHRWLYQVPAIVEGQGKTYGHSEVGRGQKVQVEFVSANPTGLLHMGNARGAALGDSIASLLSAAGFDVSREFYINDAGNQIVNFGKSLEARYLQLMGRNVPFPEDGYHGQDIVETVQNIINLVGDRYLDWEPEPRQAALIKYALKEKLDGIRTVLEHFGVRYDVWFSEQSLHDSGEVAATIAELQEAGHIYERDGALWFKATAFGEEKDEVVVRQNGVPTYFAADIAYHRNKFQRGFRWIINVWGADHHGHVSRMKGAMAALGYDPKSLDVVLMQLVRLFQGGELLRMSKRTGQYITLNELIEEVGVDAARYFFVMRSADSHLDFDLDLAKSQSADNPVYYVQYAHARIASILRQAAEMGHQLPAASECDLTVLTDPSELDLLRKIADFPLVVEGAALALEPHRLTRYAQELATLFHVFYTNCRVLVPEEELRGPRLVLAGVTRITLANLLGLIGVQAPDRM